MRQRASVRLVSARMKGPRSQCKSGGMSTSWEPRPKTQCGGVRCKAQSAMQNRWQVPQTRGTATALAVARSGKQNGSHAKFNLVHLARALMPNPSLEARPNIKTPGPRSGLAHFSTARAWRFAVGPASARTLGLMTPASQVRRHHLRVLADQRGGATALAHAVGLTKARMSQLIGSNPTGEMGERVARSIEEALSLPSGWLDLPLEGIDVDTTLSASVAEISRSSRDALDQVRENLIQIMSEHGINQSELGRRTGMSPKAINRLVSQTGEPHSPTLETLQALAVGLHTTVAALVSPGLITPGKPTATLAASPNLARQTGRLVEDFLLCSDEDRKLLLSAAAEAADKAQK